MVPEEQEIDASYRKSDGEPLITVSRPRHDRDKNLEKLFRLFAGVVKINPG
jgi:hypothetical protein